MDRKQVFLFACLAVLLLPQSAHAMHITEGVLEWPAVGIWTGAALPFMLWGLWDIKRRSRANPHFKALIALVGAAVFVISCMPIPIPWLGTCSHPCGTGMAAILIGPAPTIVVSSIALLLQAIFLAHGGFSTLGANVISMGVVGALVGYGVFWSARKVHAPLAVCAFLAGLLSDWATYAMTSFELASSLHWGENMWEAFAAIAVAFSLTQIPLGLGEGVISAVAYTFIQRRRPELCALTAREAQR